MTESPEQKLSLVKNTSWTRCACGAMPSLYHAQICGDQNTLDHIWVLPEYVEATYLTKDQSFAGFVLTRNFERGDIYIIVKTAYVGSEATLLERAFHAEPERSIVDAALERMAEYK